MGPGRPLSPIIRPSMHVTGVSSPMVPVVNTWWEGIRGVWVRGKRGRNGVCKREGGRDCIRNDTRQREWGRQRRCGAVKWGREASGEWRRQGKKMYSTQASRRSSDTHLISGVKFSQTESPLHHNASKHRWHYLNDSAPRNSCENMWIKCEKWWDNSRCENSGEKIIIINEDMLLIVVLLFLNNFKSHLCRIRRTR